MEVDKSCNVIENEQPVMSCQYFTEAQEYALKGKVINCVSHYYGSEEDRELTIRFHKLELSINNERNILVGLLKKI